MAQRSSGGASTRRARSMAGMNVVMFITDQERALQHFPPDWADRHLPGLRRLQRHGVTFNRAFTNSCMCSPARSTLMTGFFPAQHGVKYTLEEDMPARQYPQIEMPLDLPNVATVMKSAGYEAVYKGKWHLSKMQGEHWRPEDVGQYGFTRWNPPDAGANQDIPQAGGGWPNHDGRFIEQEGENAVGNEGALEYLRGPAARQQPFFMVISLVNPHDVLFYPGNTTKAGYESERWFRGELELPATVHEDLSTKPSCQRQFRDLFAATGPLPGDDQKREYLNFYGNLMTASDDYLCQVLDTLEAQGLMDDTVVIRTSDHGEMGMAHGGMRQKNFNFYEEATRVPLVWSNRRLFGEHGRTSDALVSHVDFLPTLASLFDAPPRARGRWEGVDYSREVLHGGARSQPYVVFTWDDWQAGQASGPYIQPPNHIVSVRERRWKLARYWDASGSQPDQWEMYDLECDPLERDNLCWSGHEMTPEQKRAYRRLRRRLADVQRTRLQPLPTTKESPITQQPPQPPSGQGGGSGSGSAGAKGGGTSGGKAGGKDSRLGKSTRPRKDGD